MGAVSSRQPRKITQENATEDPYYDVIFTYCDVKDSDSAKAKWEAVLYIETKDLKRVLRKGLVISEDNIQPQSDCITIEKCPGYLREEGWIYARRYILSGKSCGGWTAHLAVGERTK
ncbi:hypothetical protein BDP81DRAFT_446435 [Colletotrichum phormii]|uniref:Uncharacterized protein n=1 Tax=Colletotrichum phormii TaxID=359342 RepID=A0AAJ0EIJ7_9PEZI|nr:uncharacterized protein BDP81DRAFT_446435 [Colletotrichum phormii]KAK1640044.1 hypothetical protein BDP81DRAFT_446435 [Colletotrichum phormii]